MKAIMVEKELTNGTQDTLETQERSGTPPDIPAGREDIGDGKSTEELEGAASAEIDAGAEEISGEDDTTSGEGEDYEVIIGDRVERYTPQEMGELLAAAQEVVEFADRIKESYEELVRLREENRKFRETLEQQAQQARAIVELVQNDPILDAVLFWRRQGVSTEEIIDALQEYRDQLIQRERKAMTGNTPDSTSSTKHEDSTVEALERKVRELEARETLEYNRQVALQVLQELNAVQYAQDEEFLKIVDQIQQEIYPGLSALEHRFTPRQVRAIFQEAIAEYKRSKGTEKAGSGQEKSGSESQRKVAVRPPQKPTVRLPQQAPGNAGVVPGRGTTRETTSLTSTLSQRRNKYYEL